MLAFCLDLHRFLICKCFLIFLKKSNDTLLPEEFFNLCSISLVSFAESFFLHSRRGLFSRRQINVANLPLVPCFDFCRAPTRSIVVLAIDSESEFGFIMFECDTRALREANYYYYYYCIPVAFAAALCTCHLFFAVRLRDRKHNGTLALGTISKIAAQTIKNLSDRHGRSEDVALFPNTTSTSSTQQSTL